MAVTSVVCPLQDHEGLVDGLSAAAAPALGVAHGRRGVPPWLSLIDLVEEPRRGTSPRPSRLPSLGGPRHTRAGLGSGARRGMSHSLSFGSFGVLPLRLLGPTRPSRPGFGLPPGAPRRRSQRIGAAEPFRLAARSGVQRVAHHVGPLGVAVPASHHSAAQAARRTSALRLHTLAAS